MKTLISTFFTTLLLILPVTSYGIEITAKVIAFEVDQRNSDLNKYQIQTREGQDTIYVARNLVVANKVLLDAMGTEAELHFDLKLGASYNYKGKTIKDYSLYRLVRLSNVPFQTLLK